MNRRYSIQKQMILDALKKLDHPTAQEILDDISRQYPHLSIGTVYRNLNLLLEGGVIRRVSFPDSSDRFDIQLHPHYHMRCTRCGGIFNIDQDYLKDVDRRIEEHTGFSIESHNILFKGVCSFCKKGET